MSVGPDPNVDVNLIEQTRRQINKLVEEIARLSEMDLPPANYYGEFLQRVLTAVAAPAGAVWIRNPQGHLMLMYQINLREVGLDRGDTERQMHDELLRQMAMRAEPMLIPPHSSTGQTEGGQTAAGNPTNYVILMAPILVDKNVAGLVEIWQDPDRNPNAQQGFLQFLTRMAGLASSYTRNHQLRTMIGQQQLWTQLESFARQVHASLTPMEVSYLTANEGRRLVDCDRVSVAQRMSKRTRVEAISGADIVEKRSNLVRLMEALLDSVLVWGERLVYTGTKDDSLPPKVATALDNYLAESNSKLLVALPLKDDREKENTKPVRSIILMECFDPAQAPEQLIARLEVVGRHATAALYNAAEHKRIPFRFIWSPIAKVQEGLGGKARAITYSAIAGAVVLLLAMIFVPYPLKMDAVGQLLPVERQYLFTPREAQVVEVAVVPGQPEVRKEDKIIQMRDIQLAMELMSLEEEIASLDRTLRLFTTPTAAGTRNPSEVIRGEIEKEETRLKRNQKDKEYRNKLEIYKSDRNNPGTFWIEAPFDGKILNMDFREQLRNRLVKPNEPMLRIGRESGEWEIEVKIPQKHIGQVLQAFERADEDKFLEVDLLPRSTPTRSFKGILYKHNVAGEATPNRDDNNEAEPVVLALVQIKDKNLSRDTLPPELLLTGTEVAVKIRCGNKPLGYALFYGVWEFFYEKVVFFF